MIPLPQKFLDRPLAHRGLHDRSKGRIENAPQSFDAAIHAGYGIELDVQLSSDGHAMVFHDYDLRRLTGQNGVVAQTDAPTLGKIRLKDSNDTIPTLTETLAQIDGRVPVLIEIKDQDGGMGPNIGPLERAVAECLDQYKGYAAIMSFNPHSMAAIAPLAPTRAIGLVTDRFNAKDWPTVPANRRAELAEIPDFDRIGGSFISHNLAQLDDAAVQRIKRAGHPILCWTVKSEKQNTKARTVADNITFEGFLP